MRVARGCWPLFRSVNSSIYLTILRPEPMTKQQTSWPREEVAVSNLFLDHKNPRLHDPARPNRSQAELLSDLLATEDVEEIARSLAAQGVYPHELLIAVKERVGGKTALRVVEGNRRLAALKALVSAETVPPALRKKFGAWAKQAGFPVDMKVSVVIAPNRLAVMPILVARHTHTQIRKWAITAQAAYFSWMRDEGLPVEVISGMTQLSEADVLKPLRQYALYNAARKLELDPKVSEKVRDAQKFPMSTLMRVFESSVMLEAMGAHFEGESLVGNIPQEEFERGFGRIVTDLANNTEHSRTLINADDFKKYLVRMGSDRPNKEQPGHFRMVRSGDIEETSGSPKGRKIRASKNTTSRARRPSKNVIPRDFKPVASGSRVQKVCAELRSLDLETYPNASALLLRTLIDLCVTEHMEETGAAAACVKKFREKDNKPKGWSPSLRQSLTFLLENYDLELNDQALTAARHFANSKKGDTGLCLDNLDKFTHNAYTPPTSEELRAIWVHIEPLMRVLIAPGQ
jgi:hypothetical protein